MTVACKPYDDATRKGGYCFSSLLSKVLGVKFDDSCLKCFMAAGITVDNDARPDTRCDGADLRPDAEERAVEL